MVCFSVYLYKQSSSLAVLQPARQLACTNAWKTYHLRLHAQYSVPDDEHTMFETYRRQEEFNQNIILKIAFCWLALQNGGKV